MSHLALAILGYRIDHEHLMQTRIRHSNLDNIPDGARVEFCPECDRPTSWEEKAPIYKLGNSNHELDGFEIFFSHSGEVAVISVLAVARSERDRTSAPASNYLDVMEKGSAAALIKRKNDLRYILEKRGLIRHARYGLHAILTTW